MKHMSKCLIRRRIEPKKVHNTPLPQRLLQHIRLFLDQTGGAETR